MGFGIGVGRRVVLLLLAAAGALVSVYLVVDEYDAELAAIARTGTIAISSGDGGAGGDDEFGATRACDVNDLVSCSAVLQSEYSRVLNVPVAVLGVAYHVMLLAVLWKTVLFAQPSSAALRAGAAFYLLLLLVGAGVVAYLVYAEFVLGAICPVCTIVHVIQLLSVIVGVVAYDDATAIAARVAARGGDSGFRGFAVVGGDDGAPHALHIAAEDDPKATKSAAHRRRRYYNCAHILKVVLISAPIDAIGISREVLVMLFKIMIVTLLIPAILYNLPLPATASKSSTALEPVVTDFSGSSDGGSGGGGSNSNVVGGSNATGAVVVDSSGGGSEPASAPARATRRGGSVVVGGAASGDGHASSQRDDEADNEKDAILSLLRCIDRHHVKMFGSVRCSHCLEQKELLGGKKKHLPFFVECVDDEKQRELCRFLNVTGYPTWIKFSSVDDKTIERRRAGVMQLNALQRFADCNRSPL